MINLPFTDVPAGNVFFCSIAGAYFAGLTNGTSPTTFSPSANVLREQMAAFVSRTLNQSLSRGSRRAALGQWWKPQGGVIAGGGADSPSGVNDIVCDGTDVWVASPIRVSRFRPNDGVLVAFYQTNANTLVVAGSLIYVGSGDTLKFIFQGSLITVASGFTGNLSSLAFDGRYVWTASDAGVIGKVELGESGASSVITVRTDLGALNGLLYDGDNVWVVDNTIHQMLRLNSTGQTTAAVPVGVGAGKPVFDGINIWVPNENDDTLTVVRAKSANGDPVPPFVLATLSNNGLSGPTSVAFDGERIAVTNSHDVTLSFWRAADLTPLLISTFRLRDNVFFPVRVSSDGLSFWAGAFDIFGEGLVQRF